MINGVEDLIQRQQGAVGIELFKAYQTPKCNFRFRYAFITLRSSEVEELSHEILADYLDTKVSFGEVFLAQL